MALDVLAQGKLLRPPEQRTASTGRPYALAAVAISMDGDAEIVATVFAFRSEAQAALLALDKGDAVAVAGRGKVSVYQPAQGEPRPNLSITADVVTTAYHVRRKRQAQEADDGADDRPPMPASHRPATARQASRSGTPARDRAPLQARLPVTTGGIADLADDDPFGSDR